MNNEIVNLKVIPSITVIAVCYHLFCHHPLNTAFKDKPPHNYFPLLHTVDISMSEAIKESIITSEGHKYRGELRTFVGVAGLVCDGEGTMYYTSGGHYSGQWKMNKREGNGTMEYPDGATYEGEWKADTRHGCGQLILVNGESYEGSFSNDARNGMGTHTLPNGEKYTGAFVNNQRNGRGILDLVDGSTYEGNFKEGFMHGHGTLKLANGDSYVGGFERSAMHGKGIYMFLTGDQFEGSYEHGIRRGGTLSRRGGSEFLASFDDNGELRQLDDTATGAAIMFDSSRNADESGAIVAVRQSTILSDAVATNGWSDGDGTIRLVSGEVYTGSIRDGARCGAGKLVQANGDEYEGTWVNNQLDGEGKMVLVQPRQLGPNHHGWRYVGGFQQGVFHGFGTLSYDVDGGKYTGHWQNGLRHGLGKEEVFEEVYEGAFAGDLRHGEGILRNKQGVFRGLFVEGVMDDEDATVEYITGRKYRGALKDLKKQGEGRLWYPNGDVYDGEFRGDMRRGVGVLTQTNGDIYQGQWEDDVMQGSGTLTYADGISYDGRMAKGMKHGAGTLTDPSTGDVFHVTYRNNNIESKELQVAKITAE